MEDRARWTDLHLQDPPGDSLPRWVDADGGGREGDLRQDHLPSAGCPQRQEERLHGGRAGGGSRREHGGLQAEVPLGVPAGQPGLAVERHLPEEVPGPGPELLQDARGGLGPVQVQGLHARIHVRGRAQSRLLHQGPSVPRRLQVLHQPGDVRAGGGHSVGPRLHRVPEPAQCRRRRHPQAARRQDHRPGNAHDRAVGHRDQQHRQAVHRRARAQGAHAWASIGTR